MFFFFQAEDGIRDKLVTGVQTCALPISVPDLQNGVRQPAITATRRPLATGITFSSRKSRNLPRARCRAKLENVDERDALFASHSRRGTGIHGGPAGGRPGPRGRGDRGRECPPPG